MCDVKGKRQKLAAGSHLVSRLSITKSRGALVGVGGTCCGLLVAAVASRRGALPIRHPVVSRVPR